MHEDSQTSKLKAETDSRMIEDLGILEKFGSLLFSQNELIELKQQKYSLYHRLFFIRLLSSFKDNTIAFHKEKLHKLGLKISPTKLVSAGFVQICDWLFNPGQLIRRISRHSKTAQTT